MANEGNFTEDRKSTDPIITRSCSTDFPLMTAGPKLCYKMTDDGDVLVIVTTSDAPQIGGDAHLSEWG